MRDHIATAGWLVLIAGCAGALIRTQHVTCLSEATDNGHYTVTTCRIGGDASRIMKALPQGDDDEFDPESERAIQVGVRAARVPGAEEPAPDQLQPR